jgi:hypothetical protein
MFFTMLLRLFLMGCMRVMSQEFLASFSPSSHRGVPGTLWMRRPLGPYFVMWVARHSALVNFEVFSCIFS